MKFRFTSQATQDLKQIADYIRAENPPAAGRVRDSIVQSLQILVEFPEIGRRQSVEGVRKLISRKYGYVVYYSVNSTAGEIAILAIRHPARHRPVSDE